MGLDYKTDAGIARDKRFHLHSIEPLRWNELLETLPVGSEGRERAERGRAHLDQVGQRRCSGWVCVGVGSASLVTLIGFEFDRVDAEMPNLHWKEDFQRQVDGV